VISPCLSVFRGSLITCIPTAARTISSLYGLNAGIIDRTQFSLLVTVVVLSAVVPTAIPERWSCPTQQRSGTRTPGIHRYPPRSTSNPVPRANVRGGADPSSETGWATGGPFGRLLAESLARNL
jgi:hypothetical protein